MSTVNAISKHNFQSEVLQSPVPVVVDFYADWCGPCRLLAPLLDQMAAKFHGKVKVAKVNVDESPELAEQFHIEGIPTLLFVVGGQVVGRTSGLMPAGSLHRVMEQLAGMTVAAARQAG